MPEGICELPDCEKPRHQAQRYCGSHYMKKYRYGDPYYKYVKPFVDLTGQRFGLLVVVERQSSAWLCRCDCGNEKLIRVGDLNRGMLTCGEPWKHPKREHVTYAGAHDRVRGVKGRAREHACVACGKPAHEWAYDHADPDELTEALTVRQEGRQYVYDVAYSVKPEHYQPQCRKCHRAMDRAHGSRRVVQGPEA